MTRCGVVWCGAGHAFLDDKGQKQSQGFLHVLLRDRVGALRCAGAVGRWRACLRLRTHRCAHTRACMHVCMCAARCAVLVQRA